MSDERWTTYALMIEKIGTYRNTKVSELLSVAGRGKAGARIVEDIEQNLAAVNIGHFPPQIPRDQNARVLLYNQDRAGLGFVMHMVRQLAEGQGPAGATADEQIRGLSMLLDAHRLAPKEDAAPA
ncbi:hypothetical protein ACFWOJ_31690 [Streptomyces sp. NPDC058439]|uniref:hypothetical protein n=1 Tax=Streptomyces sp. NPDC058439 TaxID=3346500 RepID=UPI00365D400A